MRDTDGMHVDLVTKDDLTHAIREKMNVPPEAAESHAEVVLDLFGYDHQIIDNVLDPEDRQLFYSLQETGILTTRSEETLLYNGQEWRTHYWIVRTPRVRELATLGRQRLGLLPAPEETEFVYSGLPEQVWTRVKAK